jgi:hypothetical protein
MNTTNYSLADYKNDLKYHDWYYHFSDDHGVWSNGERNSARLVAIAKNGDDTFKQAYNDEYALHFNTPSFVTKDNPYTPPFKISK